MSHCHIIEKFYGMRKGWEARAIDLFESHSLGDMHMSGWKDLQFPD